MATIDDFVADRSAGSRSAAVSHSGLSSSADGDEGLAEWGPAHVGGRSRTSVAGPHRGGALGAGDLGDRLVAVVELGPQCPGHHRVLEVEAR